LPIKNLLIAENKQAASGRVQRLVRHPVSLFRWIAGMKTIGFDLCFFVSIFFYSFDTPMK
jgi:hypothetical protein